MNTRELTIMDRESEINYKLILNQEDYDRALIDFEFLSALLEHAKSNKETDLTETDFTETEINNSNCQDYLTDETSDAEEPVSVSLLSPKSTKKKNSGIEELLITEVQLRPPLWDSRLSLMNRSKNIKEKLWLEIHEKFKGKYNVNIEILQKKWKNLRDTYIKTKSSIETYIPSGSATLPKKKVWKFYESLTFLSDVMAVGSTTSSFEKPVPAESGPSKPSQIERSKNARQSLKRTCDSLQENSPQTKILKAIEKISHEDLGQNKINPLCLKISDLLERMPLKERSFAEIELLKKAYDLSKDYL